MAYGGKRKKTTRPILPKKINPREYAREYVREQQWSSLTSNKFWEAWDGFVEVREKHPLTAYAVRIILNKLNRWGTGMAVKSLEQSIERGWRGVFLVIDNPERGPVPRTQLNPEEGVEYD